VTSLTGEVDVIDPLLLQGRLDVRVLASEGRQDGLLVLESILRIFFSAEKFSHKFQYNYFVPKVHPKYYLLLFI
jgi:hypothetical protein